VPDGLVPVAPLAVPVPVVAVDVVVPVGLVPVAPLAVPVPVAAVDVVVPLGLVPVAPPDTPVPVVPPPAVVPDADTDVSVIVPEVLVLAWASATTGSAIIEHRTPQAIIAFICDFSSVTGMKIWWTSKCNARGGHRGSPRRLSD
jgi:hypothetical protein